MVRISNSDLLFNSGYTNYNSTYGLNILQNKKITEPLLNFKTYAVDPKTSGGIFSNSAKTVPLPPAQGTTDPKILVHAPSPKVEIQGKTKVATIVVDLSKNVLYKYNSDGKPEKAFLVASGKKSTPTHTGVRVVSHIETYPYKGAPPLSKRRKNPKAYGPKIIVLETLNPKTGEKGLTGEFIHGTSNPKALENMLPSAVLEWIMKL
ncbi:L,D-transpeptidase [bacterium]|nr:L,D-transpeptidase [bacterium]